MAKDEKKPLRRMGPKDAPSRTALLDATERVLARDGYAAIGSRPIATEAGLKHQLVYYYFENMDELLIATLKRRSERFQARIKAALDSDRPLRAYWEAVSGGDARLLSEFINMAHHNEAVRREFERTSRALEQVELETLGGVRVDAPGAARTRLTPGVLAFLVSALALHRATQKTLGTLAHAAEIDGFVEWALDQLEPLAPPSTRSTDA